MKISISNRLFTKVSRYFNSPTDCLREAIQNAYRSYCPLDPSKPRAKIHINVGSDYVTIKDYGRGISNPETLLSLASSEWENDVEHDQDPAGLGVCALLAYTERVGWRSAFGEVTVNGKEFFASQDYRDKLTANTSFPIDVGTEVTLYKMHDGKREYTEYEVRELVKKLAFGYGNVDIYLNGVLLPSVSTILQQYKSLGTVGTSNVYHVSDSDFCNFYTGYSKPRGVVLWHGNSIPIEFDGIDDFSCVDFIVRARQVKNFVIDISDENVVTPKLPDRKALVQNNKTVEFLKDAFAVFATGVCKEIVEYGNSKVIPSYEGFKLFGTKYSFVDGAEQYVQKALDFDVVSTFKADDRKDYYKESKKCVSITEAKWADTLYVWNGDELSDFELTHDTDGAITFDEGSIDPLDNQGCYQDSSWEPTHIVVAKVTAKRCGTSRVTLYPTTDPIELFILPKPKYNVTLDYIKNCAVTPDCHCDSIYITNADPNCDDMTVGTTIIGKASIDDVSDFNTTCVAYYYGYNGWDGDGSLEDYLKEIRAAWGVQEAELNGDKFIPRDLWYEMQSLTRSLGSSTLSFDFAHKTVNGKAVTIR